MQFFKRLFKSKSGNRIRPYGRVRNDGVVQMVFTLPVVADEKAREAARCLGEKMGLTEVEVVSMTAVGRDFSSFTLYGKVEADLNYDKIKANVTSVALLDAEAILRLVKERIKRPLVVVGISLGVGPYALGLDPVITMAGFANDRGIEYYTAFTTYHLRQESVRQESGAAGAEAISALVNRARVLKADVIVIAPSDHREESHMSQLTAFAKAVKAESAFAQTLLICAETHLTEKQADGAGYAQTFAPKTLPSKVANYMTYEWIKRFAS